MDRGHQSAIGQLLPEQLALQLAAGSHQGQLASGPNLQGLSHCPWFHRGHAQAGLGGRSHIPLQGTQLNGQSPGINKLSATQGGGGGPGGQNQKQKRQQNSQWQGPAQPTVKVQR